MARENQGLQIALIIFVMLTIVLGVTTYIFFRKYDEEMVKTRDSALKADKADKERELIKTECDELKRIIGMPNKSLDDVHKQFNSDMLAYAGTWPEESRFYSPILRRLVDTITSRDVTVSQSKATVTKLESDLANAQHQIDSNLDKFAAQVKERGDDLVKATAGATEAEKNKVDKENELTKRNEEEHKKYVDSIVAADTKVKEIGQLAAGKEKVIEDYATKMRAIDRTIPDNFNGQIDYVNQNNKTVWINLGRVDGLPRQISFSVYSGDSSDAAKAAKKGKIEVTRITGDHVAEARIVEDKDSDPLMPGDKLFTPMWSPGEQRHFALAGFLDLNGDGKNDHAAVQRLITMNSGIVDSDGDKGKMTGKMTVNTNYLICGDPPSEKVQKDDMTIYTRMCGEAKRLGIPVIPIDKLKELMGYKNETQVKHFGHVNTGGTSGNETKPKPRAAPKPEE